MSGTDKVLQMRRARKKFIKTIESLVHLTLRLNRRKPIGEKSFLPNCFISQNRGRERLKKKRKLPWQGAALASLCARVLLILEHLEKETTRVASPFLLISLIIDDNSDWSSKSSLMAPTTSIESNSTTRGLNLLPSKSP